jgi:hypothetical protein
MHESHPNFMDAHAENIMHFQIGGNGREESSCMNLGLPKGIPLGYGHL